MPSSCDMMYSHHAPLELTFDTGRFVPESYSSSPGEASTPGSLHREAQESEPVAGVPIADLLVRAVGEMRLSRTVHQGAKVMHLTPAV